MLKKTFLFIYTIKKIKLLKVSIPLYIKILQPSGYSIEYYGMPEFVQACKIYLRTVLGYLNSSRTVSDNDIDQVFMLYEKLAQV